MSIKAATHTSHTGEEVFSVTVDNGNFHITVNQYGNDTERVQVFVIDLEGDDYFYASVPMADVDRYIAEKTGYSVNDVKQLYAKGDKQ